MTTSTTPAQDRLEGLLVDLGGLTGHEYTLFGLWHESGAVRIRLMADGKETGISAVDENGDSVKARELLADMLGRAWLSLMTRNYGHNGN